MLNTDYGRIERCTIGIAFSLEEKLNTDYGRIERISRALSTKVGIAVKHGLW